eukprot:11191395-Lingulodinium_polyedra.AAC.1
MHSALGRLNQQVGFLHLDGRPQNVLRDPATPRAQLIDFLLSLPASLNIARLFACAPGYSPPKSFVSESQPG